jgi:hypothetical protein
MSARLRMGWRGLRPGARTSPTLDTNRFHLPTDLFHMPVSVSRSAVIRSAWAAGYRLNTQRRAR